MKSIFLTICSLLILSAACPAADKITFQDTESQEAIPHERTLIIQLPILEMEKITVTNRDPFVSAEVKDPYVIDSPIPEETVVKIASDDLVNQIQDALKEALSSSIKVLGVSSGEPGRQNAALIEGALPDSANYDGKSRLKYEGQSITIQISQTGIRNLQRTALLAQQQGFQVDMGFEIPLSVPKGSTDASAPPMETPSVKVTIKKIDRRLVVFRHENTGQEFEVSFKKDLDIRPDPNREQQGAKGPQKGGPKEGRPPKI